MRTAKTLKGYRLAVYYLLQWTWALIPNLIGLGLRWYILAKDSHKESFRFYGAQVTEWTKGHGSMGMGMFIFLGHKGEKDEQGVLVHEYGHTWQSVLLGPLYLLIIGLPSFSWAFLPCFVRLRKEKALRYVDFYPEAWANAWGSAITGLPAIEK